MNTTLSTIKALRPCGGRYRAFVTALRARDGRTRGDDESLPLTWILDLGTRDDALWCLRLTPKRAVLFAADCAEHVLPQFETQHPTDRRLRVAIETARRWVFGLATVEECRTAATAANAAYAAAYAAYAAAHAANAAYAAAYAAYAAAHAANAANAAAYAAYAAAHAANAAAYAAYAANAAAYAANAAAYAASDAADAAELAWQMAQLRQYWEGRLPAPLVAHGFTVPT